MDKNSKWSHLGFDETRINEYLTDDDIKAMFTNPTIQFSSILKFKKCHLLSNESYKLILSNASIISNINTIIFQNCSGVNDKTLEILAETLLIMKLDNISIIDCIEVTEKGFKELCGSEGLSVKKFNISKTPALTDHVVSVLASNQNLKHLTHLKISETKITNEAIKLIVQSEMAKNLEYLNISGCNLLTESALSDISYSAYLVKLTTIILNNLDIITSFGVNELLDLENLKRLSILNCNLIDDKIFEYLSNSTKASLEEISIMSKSIKNWKLLISYIQSSSTKSLKALKFHQTFDENEYAFDQIDSALAKSEHLTNLEVISVCSSMTLCKFFKSQNSKNLLTAEFVPHGRHSITKAFEVELKSYLKYHKDKKFQNSQITSKNRLLLSKNTNISTSIINPQFFKNLNVLTLLKVPDPKFFENLFLKQDYEQLEVLQVIQCNNLVALVEILCSFELRNLHTLHLDFIKFENLNDDLTKVINKIFRAKLPKLHTLIVNDRSSQFLIDVESIFISPLMKTLRILKLRSGIIKEENANKMAELIPSNKLSKLKVSVMDTSFFKKCVKAFKGYLQIHIKDLKHTLLASSNTTPVDNLIAINIEDSAEKIKLPSNIEIISEDLSNNLIGLSYINENTKYKLKIVEFSKLIKISEKDLQKITKYLIPNINEFILDMPSKEDGLKYLSKCKSVLSKISRIKKITIEWDFSQAFSVTEEMKNWKISRMKMLGRINSNFFQKLANNYPFLENLNIQNENENDSVKEGVEVFLNSEGAANLIKLKINEGSWFEDDFLNKIAENSKKYRYLKTLILTKNKSLTAAGILKFFRNSKFDKLIELRIGDIKNDFSFNKENIDTLDNDITFAKLIEFHIDNFNEYSVNTLLTFTSNGTLDKIIKMKSQAIKKEILKILFNKLIDSPQAQESLLQQVQESLLILKQDVKLQKKVKLNFNICKIMINNNDSENALIFLADWYYKTLVENDQNIEDEIVTLFLQKGIYKYMISKWDNYDKVPNSSMCNMISKTNKASQLKKLIDQMSMKFCNDDVLKSILENENINKLDMDWLYKRFINCSKIILLKILRQPHANFSLDFYMTFCDQFKPQVKNFGEISMFDAPIIKKITVIDDNLVEKIISYFTQSGERLSSQQLLDIFPKIFNKNIDQVVFTNFYSMRFIHIWKNSDCFSNIQKLTINTDPSLLLQEDDALKLSRITELTLNNCKLMGEIKWFSKLTSIKKLTFKSTKHDFKFINYLQQLNLPIEELELHNPLSNNGEDLNEFWITALLQFKSLKQLNLTKLSISSDKLEDILSNKSLVNIERLIIKYLPYFSVEHLKILGVNQPNLKYLEIGLHQITNQYFEVIAKNPHFKSLEVVKIDYKEKTMNFNTGIAYIFHSVKLTSFKYDLFFTENNHMLNDEIINLALELNLIDKFKTLDISNSNVSSLSFIKILDCLKMEDKQLARFIEKHSFCQFFTNDVYQKLYEKYPNIIAIIDLNKVNYRTKFMLLKMIESDTISQAKMRLLLTEFSDDINDDYIEFLTKINTPIRNLKILIQLDSSRHKNVNNLQLNLLMTTFPYDNICLAYEWVIIDSHWRNMLEFRSLKVFMASLEDSMLVFSENLLNLEDNIFLTSNGDAEILIEVNDNNKYKYTQYLKRKFEDFQIKIFKNRYNSSTLSKDDFCGDLIVKLVEQAPFLKGLNLKNKNYGDELCRKLAIVIMRKNKKGVQFIEEIILNDNPRITNVGLKNLYTTLVMDNTLTNVDVYCSQKVKKSNLDLALSYGIHNTLKIKYQEYYQEYKKRGLKIYDYICLPIALYSIICFPLALLQAFEDFIAEYIKKNKNLKKFIKKMEIYKNKIIKENDSGEEIVLDKDGAKLEKFIFTKNCVKLNNFLGNKLLWIGFLLDTFAYYFICFYSTSAFEINCASGVSLYAYLLFGIYTFLVSFIEIYLIRTAKTMIDDIEVFDISAVGSLLALGQTAAARLTLFTDLLFMVSSFSCGYNNYGIASLIFIIFYTTINLIQIMSVLREYLMVYKNPYYDSFLNLLSRYAYLIEFKAVAEVFENFAASNAVRIGKYYIPQIMLTNFMKFICSSIPQTVMQLVKLIFGHANGGNGVSLLAFISNIISLLLMFNTVMRIKPSICTPEMINEKSRSTRDDKVRVYIAPIKKKVKKISEKDDVSGKDPNIEDSTEMEALNKLNATIVNCSPNKEFSSSMLDLRAGTGKYQSPLNLRQMPKNDNDSEVMDDMEFYDEMKK